MSKPPESRKPEGLRAHPSRVHAEGLRRHLAALRDAGAALRARPAAELLADVVRWAEHWRDPESAWRQRARAELPASCGLPPAQVEWGLDAAFGALREEQLRPALAPAAGQGSWPLPLAGCIWSGALFSAGLFPLLRLLLGRVPVLCKASSQEPVFGRLVADSLSALAPALAPALAMVAWPGGDEELESILLEQVPLLVAAGGDPAMEALRARAPITTRLVLQPHRLSVLAIGRSWLQNDSAVPWEGLAEDLLSYDRQGCLSPQELFLESEDREEILRFVERFFERGVRPVAEQLPAGRSHHASAGARAQQLAVAEMLGARVWRVPGAALVLDGPRGVTLPGRVLQVRALPQLESLPQALGALSGRLQAVGLGCAPARRAGLVARLAAETSASRVCQPGTLQRPPFGWQADGLPLSALAQQRLVLD